MDYVVGSVAALISGNVTPSRPKLVRRALTPIKHQPSPNVTPKSELVDDRSIFLSPSVQKKKAIVKKSPKRIFQNPDLDVTCDGESNPSPKADKVKKHLKDKLEDSKNMKSPKTKLNKSKSSPSTSMEVEEEGLSPQNVNENTPQKKKKLNSLNLDDVHNSDTELTPNKTKKKKKKKIDLTTNMESAEVENENVVDDVQNTESEPTSIKKAKKKKNNELIENIDETEVKNENKSPKKKKHNNSISETNVQEVENTEQTIEKSKKKNKKRNKKSKAFGAELNLNQDNKTAESEKSTQKKSKSKKTYVNPNAVTEKDTDSEHDSDDEIHSENEEANEEILKNDVPDESSDDEEKTEEAKPEKKEKTEHVRTEDETKRTLFVGNVPFSKKCKKEIKKIFSKHGDIETVRIRTIPVKDARVTPKLAVIKNELHPDRSTVNVYIKYKDSASVEQALAENNTVLNGNHLRVTRSNSSGAEHDPSRALFVGNVPFAMEDDALREIFKNCGQIESVRIVRDRKTNAGKGFAYVNFASKDGVELALMMAEEDLTVKNRIMRVKRCTQTANRQKSQDSANKKGFPAKNQGKNNFGKGFNQRGPNKEREDGAQRRIMHKRKFQEGGDGPVEKRQKNLNQPQKEKKERKEFVGMTAEKKKKQTFTKGQKKKKALSEILTKSS